MTDGKTIVFLKEYKPGYYIKYDGLRKREKYTVLTPYGRDGEYNTEEEALKKLHSIIGR